MTAESTSDAIGGAFEATLSLLPEDISGLVLSQVKHQAEQALGKPVTHAVVTIPAYFDHVQRLKTKEAGNLAGFEAWAGIFVGRGIWM